MSEVVKNDVCFYARNKLTYLVASLTATFISSASALTLYLYNEVIYLHRSVGLPEFFAVLGLIGLLTHLGVTGFLGLINEVGVGSH